MLAVTLWMLTAAGASAQSLEIRGSAGPTLTDAGLSAAAGVGITPLPRLSVLVGVDAAHLPTRIVTDGRGGTSAFRGGTLTLATLGVEVPLLGRERASPYLTAGYGVGRSAPNVNARFPTRVTNRAQVIFAGGGLRWPLERGAVFVDARMMVGADGDEGIIAMAPLRVGMAWRF